METFLEHGSTAGRTGQEVGEAGTRTSPGQPHVSDAPDVCQEPGERAGAARSGDTGQFPLNHWRTFNLRPHGPRDSGPGAGGSAGKSEAQQYVGFY